MHLTTTIFLQHSEF